MKLPAFQFYPGDWMKDPNLRRCSRAARGMWADMLCLMFECADRGVLATGGTPWSDEEIAAAATGDLSEGLACISELLRKGVAHRNSSGAIFSKRMVRDEQKRRADRERKRNSRNKKSTGFARKKSVTPLSHDSSSSFSSSSSDQVRGNGSNRNNLRVIEHTHKQTGVCVSEQKSKFSLEQNQEYAWAAWRADQGIDKPHAWAAKNFSTGTYDSLVEQYFADPSQFFPAKVVPL